jgi:peptide deformylase
VRIAVVDVSGHKKTTVCNGALVLVNPVVVSSSGGEIGREGCLSIPDLTANVRRATEISVEFTDGAGTARRIDSAGFEARAILHEIDHLDGLLFLDRVAGIHDVFQRKRYA